jgi:hypothetical protein
MNQRHNRGSYDWHISRAESCKNSDGILIETFYSFHVGEGFDADGAFWKQRKCWAIKIFRLII